MRVRPSTLFRAGLASLILVLAVISVQAARRQKVLYTFGKGADGANPEASLIADAHGNLYGTTALGGSNQRGTVFELSPADGGTWTETLLHDFNSHDDGAGPAAALIFDASGNLYGTTSGGGTRGFGTVFKLSPGGKGGWTETILHSFDDNGVDGIYPVASLARDAAGNLYGTTSAGGSVANNHCSKHCGTVFELSAAGGRWNETVLHNFNYDDGAKPLAGVVFDAAGNLYGTTSEGGANASAYGVVFKLSPNGAAGWTEKVLHSFNNKNFEPVNPKAALIFDTAGNLYGTSNKGGSKYRGAVFELSPDPAGWKLKELHSFGVGDDGWNPEAGVIFDTAGHLYGTTSQDGSDRHYGIVFELAPNGNDWTETVVHRFNHSDGALPHAGVIVGANGSLYGTARDGGAGNEGVVFEISR